MAGVWKVKNLGARARLATRMRLSPPMVRRGVRCSPSPWKTAQIAVDTTSWQASGLTGTATYTVSFDAAPAAIVGAPGGYLSRPGFWHGGAGVAAVWWGGCRAVAAPLYEGPARVRRTSTRLPISEQCRWNCRHAAALLRETAADIDLKPESSNESRALQVRSAVAAADESVMQHVARSLGPAPLCQDRRSRPGGGRPLPVRPAKSRRARPFPARRTRCRPAPWGGHR